MQESFSKFHLKKYQANFKQTKVLPLNKIQSVFFFAVIIFLEEGDSKDSFPTVIYN